MKFLQLLLFVAFMASACRYGQSQLCDSWESPILVCQPERTLSGTLFLHNGIFNFTTSYKRTQFDFLSWKLDGELIESIPNEYPTASDLLYLMMDDWQPGDCPTVQLVSDPLWCALNPFCSPNAVLWTARSADLLFMGTTDALSLRSLVIWNTTTTKWLETILTYPTSQASCSEASLPFPTESDPICPQIPPVSNPNPVIEDPQPPQTLSPVTTPIEDLSPFTPPSASPCAAPTPMDPTPISSPPEEVQPSTNDPSSEPSPELAPVSQPFYAPLSVPPVPNPTPTLGPNAPSSFNVPGSTPSGSRSSHVGLIVGLSVGILLLIGAIVGAGALVWAHSSGSSSPIPGAPLKDAKTSPIYVAQHQDHFNPLYAPEA